ncbi:MAG TPA: tyrosine/phenylalanine carboxypeptidase domain-containing protein [Kofleriaceae bacterium]|nr:tyrosine/phenylalanine carboxypeptidase domain-containing protein [Kofleriaceae bacterium]
MTPNAADPLAALVRARIAAGKPVRRTLAGGGRLHVDRALPFLCVYRRPDDRADLGTDGLVRSQASYLIAPARADATALAALVDGVVESLVEACGACLVLELWSGDDAAPAPSAFRIRAAESKQAATTIEALAAALRELTSGATPVTVETLTADPAPPGHAPLIDTTRATRSGVLVLGLEVPPLYRTPTTIYPLVLRAFTRDLMHALQRGFFEFTRVQTPARPEHFQMMGRRRLVRAVRASDLELAAIDGSFDFLLAVTPVNVDEAWTEFSAGGRKATPAFRYRMLEVDPELGKRRLYDLPLDRLEDPVLAQLLRDKRRELDRQLSLLDDRDTPRFLHGSLQLYPPVDDALLAEALAILEALAPASAPAAVARTSARVGAEAFAARATRELARYRERLPSLASTIDVRDDVPSLLVSNGNLLVPRRLDVDERRVDALLQHEVGTHIVTRANGALQPLQVLASGLAGYEALQEGLAMFAEFASGGLDAERLRLIAARAVAVRRLVDGVTFPALVAELSDRHGLSPRAAFGVATRVFRGGGLTKDAIYLRGLVQLLDHLRSGGALEPLLLGKLALAQFPVVQELLWREVLRPAALRPHWLDGPRAADALARARAGLRPLDLVERVTA